MFKRNAITGLALLSVCSCVQAQEWTEQAVLSLFEQQSPMKREARAASVAAVEGLRSRTLWPNPVAAYSRETVGFTEFIQGEQQLPISGRLGLARRTLEPARQTAEAEGEARVWEIRSSLRMAFFRAFAAQRQEEVIQASLTEIQEVIEILRIREREGEGSRYDRIRVERETADLRADVALARARARSERTFLLAYLPPHTGMTRLLGELAPGILPASADDVVQRALNSRADVRSESSRLVQLALEQQAADRMKIPEPMITAGLKRTQLSGNQTGSGAVIGMSIALPFFNKGQTEVARLSAEQDRVKARRDVLTQQITATVAGAYDIYIARLDALAAFVRETKDAGAELLGVARIGYQEGELGILPLLDAYRLKRQTALRELELQLAPKRKRSRAIPHRGFRGDSMNRILLPIAVLALTACSSKPPVTEAKVATAGRVTESGTLWSAKTELFVEYPALVKGEDSRFAIHLTRLDDFKPVPAGKSEVRLTYTDGSSEVFSTEKPSKAGIFGVTVTPSRAGEVSVKISLNAPGLVDAHSITQVPVFATLKEAPTEEKPATEETISFLKEQQWALDFATGLAQSGSFRESIVVPAEITARSGGQVEVTAPLAGRLAGDKMPVLGARVDQGQLLATVIPLTAVPNDRAVLDLAKAEADAALQLARKDRDRASRVVGAGAAPRKRLDEAVTAESVAEARLRAAEERIRQFESSRSADGIGSPSFSIRAPISGTVVETSAVPGANLKGGEVLFHIVETDRVYVSAIVPEAEYPKARSLSGAEIEVPGVDTPRPAGRLISIGKIVDAPSRTFPIVYEFSNRDSRIAINQTVTIRLFLSGTRKGVTIPETALVDDAGRPIVFIQRKGEAFVRRPVDVGYRQNGLVEITSGVAAGDRIVTRGGYLIRLATLSSQIPAHGHVH